MKCQSCSEPATIHHTEIVDGKKRESHLCKACAEKQQLLKQQEVNVPGILQLLGQHLGPHLGSASDELARLACPSCGIKYMEFRAEGRLGCPLDYEVFRLGLEPLLYRIHRSGKHVGKSPRRGPGNVVRLGEVLELRQQLRAAVEAEQYEEAARIRDILRQKEATDESG